MLSQNPDKIIESFVKVVESFLAERKFALERNNELQQKINRIPDTLPDGTYNWTPDIIYSSFTKIETIWEKLYNAYSKFRSEFQLDYFHYSESEEKAIKKIIWDFDLIARTLKANSFPPPLLPRPRSTIKPLSKDELRLEEEKDHIREFKGTHGTQEKTEKALRLLKRFANFFKDKKSFSDFFYVEEPPSENIFKNTGEHWSVTFKGKTKTANNSVGMDYLKKLLQEQGKSFTTQQFLTLVGGRCVKLLTGDKQLDDEARKNYENRLNEINGNMEKAKKEKDTLLLEELQVEKDGIMTELQKAARLGGRVKALGSKYERERIRVGKAITEAIKAIESLLPECAMHLEESIKPYSGRALSYKPKEHISWIF